MFRSRRFLLTNAHRAAVHCGNYFYLSGSSDRSRTSSQRKFSFAIDVKMKARSKQNYFYLYQIYWRAKDTCHVPTDVNHLMVATQCRIRQLLKTLITLAHCNIQRIQSTII
jgi:hypothetical protein